MPSPVSLFFIIYAKRLPPAGAGCSWHGWVDHNLISHFVSFRFNHIHMFLLHLFMDCKSSDWVISLCYANIRYTTIYIFFYSDAAWWSLLSLVYFCFYYHNSMLLYGLWQINCNSTQDLTSLLSLHEFEAVMV